MIRHIVMWKLKEHHDGMSRHETAAKAKAHLDALWGVIPEIRRIETGVNAIESEAAWDLVLSADFDDAAALERYQKHPEHVKVAEFIAKIRESRAVVDYQI